MTLTILLVFLGLGFATSLGMVAVAALMIREGPTPIRKPNPAENARRYTDEGGTW